MVQKFLECQILISKCSNWFRCIFAQSGTRRFKLSQYFNSFGFDKRITFLADSRLYRFWRQLSEHFKITSTEYLHLLFDKKYPQSVTDNAIKFASFPFKIKVGNTILAKKLSLWDVYFYERQSAVRLWPQFVRCL